MRSKVSVKPPLFIGSIAMIALSVIIIFLPNFNHPVQSSNKIVVEKKPQENISLPIRLKIPKLKINAGIEYVGLTSDKAMGAPKIPSNVAWFNGGVRPGEIGSAVIAGHVNWYNGATAVFANLNKLKTGDKIIVQDSKGVLVSFVIRKVHVYGVKDDASEVFSVDDNLSHLNLITCIGIWNKHSKEYSQRLAVFAERE